MVFWWDNSMKQDLRSTRSTPKSDDTRPLSQAVVVVISLMIIAAGLWFVYQGNAPYHPQGALEETPLHLARDG